MCALRQARQDMRSPAHMIPAELPLSKHTWHSSEQWKLHNIHHSRSQGGGIKKFTTAKHWNWPFFS